MQLRLKSKITKTRFFESIDLSSYVVPLRIDQARYEADIKKFCRKFAEKIQAEDVSADDLATIRCQSEIPKFQKESITVRIGLGLYSAELEKAVIGMKTGETRQVFAGGAQVTVTVLSCVRELIPPLTEELAQNCGIPEIKSVEDALEYCRFKQYDELLDEVFDDAFSCFSSELLGSCEFDFDEAEKEAAFSSAKKSMSPSALEDENAGEFAKKLGESMLTAALFGQDMSILTEDDYNKYIEKAALAGECSIEEAKDQEPPVEYMIYAYSDIFIEKAEKYVMHRLKESGEKMQ